MVNKTNWVVSSCLAFVGLGAIVSHAQPLPAGKVDLAICSDEASLGDSPSGPRIIAFASMLAGLGPRPAAGEGEARARTAVAAELQAIGLEVTTEPFDYQTFVVKRVVCTLGGIQVDPVILGLNPFAEDLKFAGEAVIVTDPAQAGDGIKGRIVLTNHPLMQLMIAEYDPAVVICVEPGDLEAFADGANRDVTLEVVGKPLTLQSANLVARVGKKDRSGPEILVTSHLDAYQDSPGANDNGTGLGLMIELARTFGKHAEQLAVPITFVAFGAEENGVIGSRAYLQDHAAELGDIVAVINLDTLGGALGPVIATKATENVEPSQMPQDRIPTALRGRAWEGPEGRWRIIHPEIIPAALTSFYPEWLQEVVKDSATSLGVEVVHLDLISDHRTFARAGMPAISIQSKEHHIHSQEDTADGLVLQTIAACADLAERILCLMQTGTSQQTF